VQCTHSRMCSLSGRDRGNIPVVGPSFLMSHTIYYSTKRTPPSARAV
jgi:hypothetical protein